MGNANATFLVAGMTCGHCVKSVTEAVSGLTGVLAVNVELASDGPSSVMVSSTDPLDAAAVTAAVAEAGYEVVTA
jgi:copper chaperone